MVWHPTEWYELPYKVSRVKVEWGMASALGTGGEVGGRAVRQAAALSGFARRFDSPGLALTQCRTLPDVTSSKGFVLQLTRSANMLRN